MAATNVKSITDIWTLVDKKPDKPVKKTARARKSGNTLLDAATPLKPVRKLEEPKSAKLIKFVVFQRRVGSSWNVMKSGPEDTAYMMMTGAESIEEARGWIDRAFTEMTARYPELKTTDGIGHASAGDIDIYWTGGPTFKLEYIIEPAERVIRDYES